MRQVAPPFAQTAIAPIPSYKYQVPSITDDAVNRKYTTNANERTCSCPFSAGIECDRKVPDFRNYFDNRHHDVLPEETRWETEIILRALATQLLSRKTTATQKPQRPVGLLTDERCESQ